MIIGLDLGTTHLKGVLMADDGRILDHSIRPNQIIQPRPGWNEIAPIALFQQVEDILCQLAKTALRQAEAFRGLAFSGAMHGIMALDHAGTPLTNLWIWSDLRSKTTADLLRQSVGDGFYRHTGVPVHPMAPLCKVRWMRDALQDVFQRARMFLGVKEYIWHRLTGEYCADISCASASGFLDLHQKEYYLPALEWAGIASEQLPTPVSIFHQAPYTGDQADLQRLFKSTPLTIGASDGALANIGSGAQQAVVTIGTSAAIRRISTQPVLDAHMRTFCYAITQDTYIAGGASNNGANTLEWLRREVMASRRKTASFLKQADQIEVGAEGLLFVPYLHGERAPVWDAEAKGAFWGLTAHHRQAHFVRAVMEGVLLNLQAIAVALPGKTESIVASGGFIQSKSWVKMLADITGVQVTVPDIPIDASLAGAIQLIAHRPFWPSTGAVLRPDESGHVKYQQVFEQFKQAAGIV